MAWRVAITSNDGATIDLHFGQARRFFIIDIERDGSFRVVEERPVQPWCSGDKYARDAEPGDSGIADSIRDCSAMLTARIGLPPRKKLEMSGVAVFEESLRIDDAAKKLAIYYARTNCPEITTA